MRGGIDFDRATRVGERLGNVLVALSDCLLNVASTCHRLDEPVEERPGVLQNVQRFFLVIAHEPAIGSHIGAENRGEFALSYMLIQGTTSLDGGGNGSPL